jgi:transposase
MSRRNRRKYTPEQKADAVRLVREVGNLAKVARDLELTETSLRHWVKQAEIDEGRGTEGALTTEEREELRRLRRENRTLEMERDFLKNHRAPSRFLLDQKLRLGLPSALPERGGR